MGARPDFSIELDEYTKGNNVIAGIDEAGRGSLAGPLSVSMVIYPSHFFVDPPQILTATVNDSKKLPHKRRVIVKEIICTHCIWWGCVFIEPEIIDTRNINGATHHAITTLIEQYGKSIDVLLVDGNFSFPLQLPYRSIKKGDTISLTIASASIIAKVTRDLYMLQLDANYPQYGFAHHKGYATTKHIEAIKQYGPSSVHRKSFDPVAQILSHKQSLFE